VGVAGFALLGTLCHLVPFIVWVHRYSDRLGLEPVPMIDDLYSDRLTRADFAAFLVGGPSPPGATRGSRGTLVLLGSLLFAWNLASICRRHTDLWVLSGASRGSTATSSEPDRPVGCVPADGDATVVARRSPSNLGESPHAEVFAEPRTIRLALAAEEGLPAHTDPDRTVPIHVLSGRLSVAVDDERHELCAGELLRFDGARQAAPTELGTSTALLVLATR
jgi:hypothetical protein